MKRILIFSTLILAAVACRKEVFPEESTSCGMDFKVSLAGYSSDNSHSETKALSSEECGEVIYLSEQSGEWDIAPETKSAPVSALYDSFGCSAYSYPVFGNWTGDELPTVFYNREISKSGSSWVFADGNDYKWPGATFNVRFFAYSPYSETNPKMVSTASVPDAPVIEFTCGTDVAAQTDLLECASDPFVGSGTSQVSLTFRHALAAVKVKTSSFGFAGKITKVELENINSYGKTAIGSDVWTAQSTPVTYTFSPSLNVTVEGDCETAAEYTVFCIPQTLASDAVMKITFEQNSQNYVYECPLAGKELKKNTLTTYTIGCNLDDIATGVNVSATAIEFTNTSSSASQTVNVKSYTVHASGITNEVPWTVDYSTDGTSFSSTKPDWITLSATSGTGSAAGQDVTITVNARATEGKTGFGLLETERTAALKAKSEVGTSASPVDLSMLDYNGNTSSSMNTANCYVIHAPGWYKIPLVYGNAIKDGVTNTESFYTSVATDFEDSYGVSFTASSSPYIKAHVTAQGKTLGEAALRWCDIAGCVIDVDAELMDAGSDCPYIKVYIPKESISECNALVTVKDSDGNVAWSWHLWVSGADLSPVTITDNSSVEHDIMPVNLGWNGWIGTVSFPVYPARECYVRFKNASGSKIVRIFQTEKATGEAGTSSGSGTVYSSAPYYQWGRKDAFIGGNEAPSATGNITYSESAGSQAQAHQNPTIHYRSSSFSWTQDTYYYFWNTMTNTTSEDHTKSIYDPCPVGWSVPSSKTFTYFSISNVIGSFDKGYCFKRNASDATGVFFPASGYRDYASGGLSIVGSSGGCWSYASYSQANARYLLFYSGGVYPLYDSNRAYGFSVRPCRELN